MDDYDEGNVWDKASVTPDQDKPEPATTTTMNASSDDHDHDSDSDSDTRRDSTGSLVDETTSEEADGDVTKDTIGANVPSIPKLDDDDDDAEAWGAASDDEDPNNNQEFAVAISALDLNKGISASELNDVDDVDKRDSQDEASQQAGPSTLQSPPPQPSSFSTTTLLAPPASTSNDPFANSQGQFDEFPEDDFDGASQRQQESPWERSAVTQDEEDDDGFGDFGDTVDASAGGAGGIGDDDDFGDFDEAGFDPPGGSGAGTTSFGAETSVALTSSTSILPTMPYPDLTGCLPDLNPEDTAPIIRNYFETVFPDMYAGLAEPLPEMYKGETIQDIMADIPGAQEFWKRLVEDPVEYTPFDWKRSRARRDLAEAVGVTLNPDEFTQTAPAQSMKLPSIRTTPASPSKSGTKADQSFYTASPTSASANAPPLREASSSPKPAYLNGLGHPPVRPSTPSSSAVLQRPIPPLNLSKCAQLTALREEDLSLKTLAELEMLRTDLNETAVETGTHLTALLERKELLSGQNDTYNAMIQDLVIAAQKMRSSSSPAGGQSTSRKPSIRRTNSNSKMPASSNSTAAATATASSSSGSKFWGGGSSSNSRPNSRPASPAPPPPPGNLKTSLGRSSAANDGPTSAGAGRDPTRRTSLW